MVLGTFPKALSQVGTYQMFNFPISNFLKVRLDSLMRCRLQWGAKLCGYDGLRGRALRLEQAEGRALKLGQTWEVAVWKIAHLGSCHMVKILWESTKHKIKCIWKRMEKNGKEYK